MLSMGKSTISMVIFNSYVTNYQRVYPINIPLNHYKIPLNPYKIPLNHYKGLFHTQGAPTQTPRVCQRYPGTVHDFQRTSQLLSWPIQLGFFVVKTRPFLPPKKTYGMIYGNINIWNIGDDIS